MCGGVRKDERELPEREPFLFGQYEACFLFLAVNADHYPLINV